MYQINGKAISYPLEVQPDANDSSSAFVVNKAAWFDDKTDIELAAWNITRVADPVMPSYDPATQKVITLDTGYYDVVDLSPAEQQAYFDGKKSLFESWIQTRLDSFAQTRGYDNVYTCVSYENDNNTTFANEAAYMKQARSDTWVAAATILQEVQNGTRAMPSSPSDIETDLPALAWP